MSRPSLFLMLPCQGVVWGWARGWEGTQLGELTPTEKKGYFIHITSGSAIMLGGGLSKVAVAWGLEKHCCACGRWRVIAFASLRHF